MLSSFAPSTMVTDNTKHRLSSPVVLLSINNTDSSLWNRGGSSSGDNDNATMPNNNSTVVIATSSVEGPDVCSRFSPSGRIWMSDRKGIWDSLHTRALTLSCVRVSVLQALNILSGFVTDQMEQEVERDELLMEGKITEEEFEKQNSLWEEVEWNNRWKAFPRKALIGVTRFHAVTLMTRFYESIICDRLFQLSPPAIDKLTKDPLASALRKKERLDSYVRYGPERFHVALNNPSQMTNTPTTSSLVSNDTPSTTDTTTSSNDTSSSNTTNYRTQVLEVTSRQELGMQMVYTCFWSNILAFLSDHTVQQALLLYGYYMYCCQRKKMAEYKRRQQKLNKKEGDLELVEEVPPPSPTSASATNASTPVTSSAATESTSLSSLSSNDYEFREGERGGIFLSFLFRSSRIAASRALGLVTASIGGAIGSMMYPGWGTVIGIQMGDALAGAAIDE